MSFTGDYEVQILYSNDRIASTINTLVQSQENCMRFSISKRIFNVPNEPWFNHSTIKFADSFPHVLIF